LGIRTGLNGIEEFHVGDVIDIYLILDHDDESPSVKLHGEDRRGKRELADGRLSLSGNRMGKH
jgi:hypothetical protein